MHRLSLGAIARSLAVALALAGATTTAANAADYTLDPVHTQAVFVVTHLAVSKVHGQIPLTAGTLDIGANDLPTGGTATFDVTQLDSNDDNRDKSLKSEAYLDAAKYPTMTFVVRKVVGTPQAFTLTGDLTIHGVTKSVDLKGSEVGSAVVKGARHIGYTATTTIDRRDFGIAFANFAGGSLIAGYNVDISIDVDAVQKAPAK
jgi:polyisoprenoid-binding protein YceI